MSDLRSALRAARTSQTSRNGTSRRGEILAAFACNSALVFGGTVWIPMNAADRPDIRRRMRDLALLATAKMKAAGQHTFEIKCD
jgi:hypothetical protein